jgi:hypothetical protein
VPLNTPDFIGPQSTPALMGRQLWGSSDRPAFGRKNLNVLEPPIPPDIPAAPALLGVCSISAMTNSRAAFAAALPAQCTSFSHTSSSATVSLHPRA